MKVTDRRGTVRSRLRLTSLGVGTSAIGGLYEAVEERTAAATLQEAWNAGLRYFDTAPYYGYTLGEQRLGALLRELPRDEVVVSTKVGRLMQPDASVRAGDDGWATPLAFRPVFDYSRDAILRSFEDSCQRLGLERIDLVLVHDIGRMTHGTRHAAHWDALTRGGGFRALEELRAAGLIQAFGLGVNEVGAVRDAMNEVRLDCTLLAGRYTLLEQGGLALLDDCAERGTDVVIGGPFNSGLLAGQRKFEYGDAPAELLARADALRAVCASHDVALEAAALQFPLGHPAVVSVVTGMRSPAEVRANVDWFERPIPAALWDDLRSRGLLDPNARCPGNSA
jgi:D-threo-aldose 1-dehydrogenase